MKKGFTLIELLAVIIILAILMVVAVPNVLSTLNDAKKKTFVTQAQSIWKSAEQTFIVHSLTGEQKECYDLSNPLDLGSISNSISYVVRMNVQTGKVESIKVRDTNQNFEAEGVTTNGITVKVENSDEPLSCGNSGGSGGSGGGGTAYLDGILPVAPKLGNLIPIKHDGTNWVYANIYEEWYNYGTTKKQWANAVVLANGATKSVGDTITEDEIDLWFVWVPRYEYKLPADSIGTTGTPKAIDIKFISSSKTTPTSGYAFHPGFAWDSDWSNGISEWKDGIWFGKFESTADSSTTNSIQKIKIKANIASWRSVTTSNMYNSSLNMDTDYNLTQMDSHMARYTEWTTVPYLANSIYGRCTNATTCTEITKNASDQYLTGRGAYKTYYTQTSTINITGIYDISGGSIDQVSGYLTGVKASSGFTTLPTDNTYVDVFTSSDTSKGNYSVITAVNGNSALNGIFAELLNPRTETVGWYEDNSASVTSTNAWFGLGGYYRHTFNAGGFASHATAGGESASSSFRTVLVNK